MHAESRGKTADSLQRSLSRDVLLKMLDDLPLGVAVHEGADLVYVYLNPALQAMSGDREMLGRPFAEAWPEFADIVLPVARQVLETGEPYTAEDRAFGTPTHGVEGEPAQRCVTFSFHRIHLDGEPALLVAARDTTAEVAARRKAERETSELDAVLERMGDGFFALDCDWRFVYVNKRAEELLRTPKAELLGKNIWDVFGRAVGTAFDTEFHRAMRLQEPARFQEYYAPSDMWASVQAYPSESGLSVFLSNITSLKEQEAALATSEAQLRAVIDNSPNAIHMKDSAGVFIRVNDEFARLFGMPREQIVGKTDHDLLPPEAAARLEENDREVRQAGRPLQFEEEADTPAEGHRRYLTTKFPLKDLSGRIYGTAGISADITKRSEQERRLAESEERFRKVFEEGPYGIVLIEPATLRIVTPNDAYQRLTGYSKEELSRMSLLDVTFPDDRAKTRQLVDLVIKGEIPFYRWEKRYLRKDGTVIWTAVTGSLLHDEAGRPSLFLGIVEDVSQRKQAEAALRDKDLAIRKAYSDVIDAVTGGKLVLLTPDELPDLLGRPVSPKWHVAQYEQFSTIRHELAEVLRGQGLDDDDIDSYVLAAMEAATNAVKHGGGGSMGVRRGNGNLQIEVTDHGPGIDFEYLPKAALVPGFSTKATLGMGFTIMLEVCDRLLLTTQPGLTVVVLEKTM